MIKKLSFLIALTLTAPLLAQTTPPPAPKPKPATVYVAMTTTAGTITIEMEREKAPITSANFLRYVDQRRFDGISFYRRVQTPGTTDQGFIQGGTQDPKRLLPPIAHEPTSKTGLSHVDGALSAPRWAPGSARGDFTIMSGDAKWMDADPKAPGDNLGYAVFARVIDGMDIVRKILVAPVSTTKGAGVMRGQMLEPQIRILTMRRMTPPPVLPRAPAVPKI
jgi:peptidyl-prolyl cis-trans isomerase A (cyclophilin A)